MSPMRRRFGYHIELLRRSRAAPALDSDEGFDERVLFLRERNLFGSERVGSGRTRVSEAKSCGSLELGRMEG